MHQYKVSFEVLFHIQCFLSYIFSTLSRTDVPYGGPAFHAAGTGASRFPGRSTRYPAFVTKLQVASELCMSRVHIL